MSKKTSEQQDQLSQQIPAQTEQHPSLSRTKLEAAYKEATGQDADESLTDDQLLDVYTAAMENKAKFAPRINPVAPIEPEEKTFFGNKDEKKAWELPSSWKKDIVVYQYQVQTLNGGMVEVPNTGMVQTYTPQKWDELQNTKPNFFAESGLKYEVLHDPR